MGGHPDTNITSKDSKLPNTYNVLSYLKDQTGKMRRPKDNIRKQLLAMRRQTLRCETFSQIRDLIRNPEEDALVAKDIIRAEETRRMEEGTETRIVTGERKKKEACSEIAMCLPFRFRCVLFHCKILIT